jgi:hypothetical protein
LALVSELVEGSGEKDKGHFIYICVFFTDMNDVAIFVNHNIAVMTIFDLQQENLNL